MRKKEYADKVGIELEEVGDDKRVYSIDSNLWGQAIEGEDLEDPWHAPQEDAFTWTRAPKDAPDSAEEGRDRVRTRSSGQYRRHQVARS